MFPKCQRHSNAGYNFSIGFLFCYRLPVSCSTTASLLLPSLKAPQFCFTSLHSWEGCTDLKKHSNQSWYWKWSSCLKSNIPDRYRNCLSGLPSASNFIFTLFKKNSLIKEFLIFVKDNPSQTGFLYTDSYFSKPYHTPGLIFFPGIRKNTTQTF